MPTRTSTGVHRDGASAALPLAVALTVALAVALAVALPVAVALAVALAVARALPPSAAVSCSVSSDSADAPAGAPCVICPPPASLAPPLTASLAPPPTGSGGPVSAAGSLQNVAGKKGGNTVCERMLQAASRPPSLRCPPRSLPPPRLKPGSRSLSPRHAALALQRAPPPRARRSAMRSVRSYSSWSSRRRLGGERLRGVRRSRG